MKFSAEELRRLPPILLAQGIALVCGVASVRLATRWIAPADYGLYGVFVSFTPLGMWVAHAGLVKFTARHWAAADRRGLYALVSALAWRRALWLIPAALAAALFIPGPHWAQAFPLLVGATAALGFAALGQAALQAARENWRDCAVSGVGSVTRSFIPPLLYLLLGGGVVLLWTGFLAHAVIFALVAVLAARFPHRGPADGQVPAMSGAYEGALFTWLSLVGWALSGLNRWVVVAFFGATITGYFTLAHTLATIVPSMLSTAIVQFVQPGLFALPVASPADRRRLAALVDRTALVNWLATLATLLALRAALPLLVGTLVDEKYLAVSEYILPAGCFAVATSTALLYHIMLLAGKCESACGPLDLSFAAVLVTGSVATAWLGWPCFRVWLLATPLVPWLLCRPLARRLLFKAA